jgi:hypothetical protein
MGLGVGMSRVRDASPATLHSPRGVSPLVLRYRTAMGMPCVRNASRRSSVYTLSRPSYSPCGTQARAQGLSRPLLCSPCSAQRRARGSSMPFLHLHLYNPEDQTRACLVYLWPALLLGIRDVLAEQILRDKVRRRHARSSGLQARAPSARRSAQGLGFRT